MNKLFLIVGAVLLIISTIGVFSSAEPEVQETQLTPEDSVNPEKVTHWSNPTYRNGTQINWKEVKDGDGKELE